MTYDDLLHLTTRAGPDYLTALTKHSILLQVHCCAILAVRRERELDDPR